MKGMLGPGQEVVLIGGVHMLHDHERLAMALEDAIEHRSEAPLLLDGTPSPHPQLRSVLDPVLLLEVRRCTPSPPLLGLEPITLTLHNHPWPSPTVLWHWRYLLAALGDIP